MRNPDLLDRLSPSEHLQRDRDAQAQIDFSIDQADGARRRELESRIDFRKPNLHASMLDSTIGQLDLDDRSVDKHQFLRNIGFAKFRDHIDDVHHDRFRRSAAHLVESQFGSPFGVQRTFQRYFQLVEVERDAAVEPSGFGQQWDGPSES